MNSLVWLFSGEGKLAEKAGTGTKNFYFNSLTVTDGYKSQHKHVIDGLRTFRYWVLCALLLPTFFLIRILIFITHFLQRTLKLIQLAMEIHMTWQQEHTHTQLQVLSCWVLSLYMTSYISGYGPTWSCLCWFFNPSGLFYLLVFLLLSINTYN